MIARVLLSAALLLAPAVDAVQAQNAAIALSLQSESMGVLPAERCEHAPNGLPDGCVARGSGDIRAAWYVLPTTRYSHGILGDAVEAGGLRVELANGGRLDLALPEDEVFEDRTPRLVDLDGDGRTEVVTIRSSLSRGASVAVFGIANGLLMERTSTPFIGRANRWLNIAGIADFLGRGDRQIAFVETPHIGGTLKIAAMNRGRLEVMGALSGFSNHAIGEREQRLALDVDLNGDGRIDLLLPNAARDEIHAVQFTPQPARIASIDPPGRVDALLGPQGGERRARVQLDDGSLHSLRW